MQARYFGRLRIAVLNVVIFAVIGGVAGVRGSDVWANIERPQLFVIPVAMDDPIVREKVEGSRVFYGLFAELEEMKKRLKQPELVDLLFGYRRAFGEAGGDKAVGKHLGLVNYFLVVLDLKTALPKDVMLVDGVTKKALDVGAVERLAERFRQYIRLSVIDEVVVNEVIEAFPVSMKLRMENRSLEIRFEKRVPLGVDAEYWVYSRYELPTLIGRYQWDGIRMDKDVLLSSGVFEPAFATRRGFLWFVSTLGNSIWKTTTMSFYEKGDYRRLYALLVQ